MGKVNAMMTTKKRQRRSDEPRVLGAFFFKWNISIILHRSECELSVATGASGSAIVRAGGTHVMCTV